MEDLNKNQIILLTILISFVTSIATGIMTTSLLMEAPVEVTQTINRVVERTIETVTPTETAEKIINRPTEKREVTTVVVSEEDRVIDAISKNTKSIVRIREKNEELGINNFFALGIIVRSDGLILTDKKFVSDVMQYEAVFSDGSEVPLVFAPSDKKSSFTFFLAKPKDKMNFIPAGLSLAEPKLGQSVIALGGDQTNAVSIGRISSINFKDSTSTTTPKTISSIQIDVSPVDNVYGAPIISLSGEVIGINLSDLGSSRVYVPVSTVKDEL